MQVSQAPFAPAGVVLFSAEGLMKTSDYARTDRVLRTAAWTYLAPRALIGVLILAAFGLAAFLVLVQLAITLLHRLGA